MAPFKSTPPCEIRFTINKIPVQAAAEGFVKQFFRVVTSVVVAVHVVLSHLAASTDGMDVLALYVPKQVSLLIIYYLLNFLH